MDALVLHRIQFAFTITFHYLFPQLTMGLALLILILKTIGIMHNRAAYNDAARFWGRIFAVNFIMGVVTGIPMEFQIQHQLVSVLAGNGQRYWPASCDGGRLLFFP